MKTLRLVLFRECNRKCKGCCNKKVNWKKVPYVSDFFGFEDVVLTGGEPLLRPGLVIDVARQIRRQNPLARIFLYTAMTSDIKLFKEILREVDGITVTIHEDVDKGPFFQLAKRLSGARPEVLGKSLRVNAFEEAGLAVSRDLRPEENFFRRSDNISFAMRGVVAQSRHEERASTQP